MSTAPTTTAASPIATIFAFSDPLIFQALDGLTKEELWRRFTPSNNPLLWSAGHVTQTGRWFCRFLGNRLTLVGETCLIAGLRSERQKTTPPALRLPASCAKSARVWATQDWLIDLRPNPEGCLWAVRDNGNSITN
jgi:hypothetical protein